MIPTIFVDANVFLRFFTLDDAGQHQQAADLFGKAASGKIHLISGPPVLFEIAWTLKSAYDQSRERILDVISAILALPGLGLTDDGLVEDAIDLARANSAEFADAYIAASAGVAGASHIATFNQKHFEKLGASLYGLA